MSRPSSKQSSDRHSSDSPYIKSDEKPKRGSLEYPRFEDLSSEVDPDITLDIDIETSLALECKKKGFEGSRKCPNRMKYFGDTRTSPKPKYRGRPIKSYELEPFLVVDTTVQETPCSSTVAVQIQKASQESLEDFDEQSSITKASSIRLCKLLANRSSPSPSFQSQQTLPKKPSTPESRETRESNVQKTSKFNHQVKMPFKHSVKKPASQQDKVRPPSQDMKDQTAYATRQVNRMLVQERTQQPKKIKGKLLIGSDECNDVLFDWLKPLYPVENDGPPMELCRGIMSMNRSYSANLSRSVHRQKVLVSNINDYCKKMSIPTTSESLHRHSITSSPGALSPESGEWRFERAMSRVSISPLSFESDPDLYKNKSHNATEEEHTGKRSKGQHKPIVDELDSATKEALTKASRELMEAVDSLQDQHFEGDTTREIDLVAKAQNVNNNNSNNEENYNGVKNSVQKQLFNGNGKGKENIFITEEAENGSIKTDTDSCDQRPFSATTIAVNIKTAGRPESTESSKRPQTTGSFVLRGGSNKSVRFADQRDKTTLSNSWMNGLQDECPHKQQPKPSRSTCKPQKPSRNARSHDHDDDKENIPRNIYPGIEGKSTKTTSASNSATNPGCPSTQGNTDGLEDQCSVEERLTAPGFNHDDDKENIPRNIFSGIEGKSTKTTSATNPGCQSMQENTDGLEDQCSVEEQFSVPGPDFQNVKSQFDASGGSREDLTSHSDTEQSVLHQLQLKEMEPLVIELTESRRLDEGCDSYKVSECSTVLGVLEKYPDLCKYLKVESISGNAGERDSADVSEADSSEPVQAGSQQAFKITFSSYEPAESCPSTPNENRYSQDQSTETEAASRSLRRRRKKRSKASVPVSKSFSSASAKRYSYEACTRQNFPSDILDIEQESPMSENSKYLDTNSVPVDRSFNQSCQSSYLSRRNRPSSASSSKSRPTSASSSKSRPTSASSIESFSSRLSYHSTISSRASQQANRVTRRGGPPLERHHPQRPKTNLRVDHASSVPQLDQDPPSNETDPVSFSDIDQQIDAIQSELRRNIDENAFLLSRTESLRETLKLPNGPVDDPELSSNSDLDSAVCDESSPSPIAPSCKVDRFDLASEEYYQNVLLSYRKMCMDISEDCLVISDHITTPRWQTSQSSEAVVDNGGGQQSRTEESKSLRESGVKIQSDVVDSGCESEQAAEVVNEEVTDKRETSLLELLCETLPENKDDSAIITKNECDNSDLEVIATTKKLSKPRVKVECVKPSAPFPPLCFSVNARPPAGCLYYFSYGTDMNIDRISNYLNRKVEDRFWGLLFGFSLVFNKKGFDVEAGGFPNIEFNPFCSVEGCVYQLTPNDVHILDKCIGYPEHYEHVMLPVWMSNCKDPDSLGIAQYCVPALTYIAQEKWIEKDLVPCEFAVSQCLKSSDLVTPQYKEHLLKKTEVPSPTVEAAV